MDYRYRREVPAVYGKARVVDPFRPLGPRHRGAAAAGMAAAVALSSPARLVTRKGRGG